MRQKILGKLGQLSAEKTGWMLVGIVIITLIFGMLAGTTGNVHESYGHPP